ncbi:hypothetical protein, partial [Lacisediminimonas sp.]|uniref:hypothetical protein n=1 Tax=Lacisediminimonas sp. TaxID=3060582 RepID=UPI0027215F10
VKRGVRPRGRVTFFLAAPKRKSPKKKALKPIWLTVPRKATRFELSNNPGCHFTLGIGKA